MNKPVKPSELNEIKSAEFMEFFNELQSETHRGGVLVGAAFLDEYLRQLLAAFLIDRKTEVKKLLDKPDSPLGLFSSRILVAYCLGLISREMYHDLEIIRRIRNQFAHALHGLSFEDAWVIDECTKLIYPQNFQFMENFSNADRFIMTIAIISMRLKLTALGLANEKRQVRKNEEVINVNVPDNN